MELRKLEVEFSFELLDNYEGRYDSRCHRLVTRSRVASFMKQDRIQLGKVFFHFETTRTLLMFGLLAVSVTIPATVSSLGEQAVCVGASDGHGRSLGLI